MLGNQVLSAQSEFKGPAPLRALIACVCAGVFLRAALCSLAGTPALQSDEANYFYLAVQWKQLGYFPDSFRYLWPPAYAAYLRVCIELFGSHALDAARAGQILASASVGFTTGLIAWRVFGARAAVIAAALWAGYLPLAAHTHLLWNEPIFLAFFLPGFYQVLVCIREREIPHIDRRLVSGGVLLALALYVKEAATYLIPLLGLVLLFSGMPLREGLRRASLLLGTVALCVLPWGLRNQQVYGAFIPLGSSLGENAFNGLNAPYRNFDLIPIESKLDKAGKPPLSLRPYWTAPPAGAEAWTRAEEIHSLPLRMSENTARGLAFARAHPAWLLRSRIQKVADVLVPTSFLTRHLALDRYSGRIASKPWRPIVAWTSALQVAALLVFGGAGLLGSQRPGPARRLIWTTALYFGATVLLVSMSRFRIPLVPFLLAGIGGLFTCVPKTRGAWLRILLWFSTLAFAWWLNAPVLADVWKLVLSSGEAG